MRDSFLVSERSLQEAPVLGHLMEGLPYHLYTDASDEALGCALQQVQPMKIADLKGTRIYDQLKKAHELGKPPPKLVVHLSSDLKDDRETEHWGETFKETVVYVERVIAYWSRTFKSAETWYSTTEREALGAKEGLVKFQPFIEGERLTLITDHAALQWAKTYENSNRRLAAWGTVFSAYAPQMSIIHRPGRKHLNVDPLSRLYRAPPPHSSPARDDSSKPLEINPSFIDASINQPAEKMAFVAYSLSDCLEETPEVFIRTRSNEEERDVTQQDEDKASTYPSHHLTEDPNSEYWGATNPPPNIHVHMSEEALKVWVNDYKQDPHLVKIWDDPKSSIENWVPGHRFFKDGQGLLFFRDADYQPRLCVPKNQRLRLLEETHEQAYEGAHPPMAVRLCLVYWTHPPIPIA